MSPTKKRYMVVVDDGAQEHTLAIDAINDQTARNLARGEIRGVVKSVEEVKTVKKSEQKDSKK